jgi:hypothetical protein
MSNLAKLTDAVLACPPDLDCYQHGAAVYYDIPYADVSPQQRAAVKSLTWLARYSEGHRFDPLAAGRVHDEIVIDVDPAYHERVVAPFLARIMNQPIRKAITDLETLTRLVPENLLELATNRQTFPRPMRVRWESEHMNVPVRFVDPQRGLSSVGETERETWARYMREQAETRGYRGPTDVSLSSNIPRTHIDWLDPPKPKVWPRDYPTDAVRDVLGFVARGEFTFGELWDLTIARVAHPYTGRLISRDIARTSIRRAKLERRIRWCPYSQRYIARPAWQHRPKHDRRGWTWSR